MKHCLENRCETRIVSFIRWWRAPEVFVNWERYDDKLDTWSVGCVIAELILLKPLFPGSDYVDQLKRILRITGTPAAQTLQALCEPSTCAILTDDKHYRIVMIFSRSLRIYHGVGTITESRFQCIIRIQVRCGHAQSNIRCIRSR
jgi:serine/threonine protein kinase